METEKKSAFAIPIAIVIAGGLIALALYYSKPPVPGTATTGTPSGNITVRPVSADDHILGSPNADIVIVEYSDTECPYCKTFHPTMQRIIDEYGRDGKVAWVYRHFPLYKGEQPLHPRAFKEAVATECANELGGSDKFWQYLNKIYEITPANNGLDPAQLPKIATDIGLDTNAFQKCLDSNKYDEKISKSYDEALAAGANGTPYSVMLTKKSPTPIPISGAQPYTAIKPVIEAILSEQSS